MYNSNIIFSNENIVAALRKINACSGGMSAILFVVNDTDCVIGAVSDGDIRRYLISGGSLNDKVGKAMRTDFIYIDNVKNYSQIKKAKLSGNNLVPLLTKDKKLREVVNFKKLRSLLPIDVVIMAGGQGIRLKPYTDNIPKPMLELAGKPIIARNIDRLKKYGIRNFYISVNYLKDQIKDYLLKEYESLNISFIEEKRPLGTIGAVGLIDDFQNEDVIVMNADLLTNIDFTDLYEEHKKHDADITLATFNIKVDVPYAVLETENEKIRSFTEKPTYIYYSSAGIYVLKKETIKNIPANCPYDATDLVQQMINCGKKVNHFPIRGYWLDIGTAQNYSKAQDDVNHIKF